MPTGPVSLHESPGLDGYRRSLDAALSHLQQVRESGAAFVFSKCMFTGPTASASGQLKHADPHRTDMGGGSATRRIRADFAEDQIFQTNQPPSSWRDSAPVSQRWKKLSIQASTMSKIQEVPVLPPLPPKLQGEARTAAFADLQSRTQSCLRCPNLVASRSSVVFGVGDIHARLMFIGEAPGADEDVQGEPFVGKAGELLTKIITAMGLSRPQVYIANILKCRPDTPGQTAGNRKPTPAEMATCIPWLHEQINLIQPEAMVALGATAVEGLLGKTDGIMKLRGNWRTYRGIPLMPTFHPAYLLRNQAPTEKRKVWEDMLAVLKHLNLPISQKQQNFFTNK